MFTHPNPSTEEVGLISSTPLLDFKSHLWLTLIFLWFFCRILPQRARSSMTSSLDELAMGTYFYCKKRPDSTMHCFSVRYAKPVSVDTHCHCSAVAATMPDDSHWHTMTSHCAEYLRLKHKIKKYFYGIKGYNSHRNVESVVFLGQYFILFVKIFRFFSKFSNGPSFFQSTGVLSMISLSFHKKFTLSLCRRLLVVDFTCTYGSTIADPEGDRYVRAVCARRRENPRGMMVSVCLWNWGLIDVSVMIWICFSVKTNLSSR